jgi:hypothetical protein
MQETIGRLDRLHAPALDPFDDDASGVHGLRHRHGAADGQGLGNLEDDDRNAGAVQPDGDAGRQIAPASDYHSRLRQGGSSEG